MEKRNSDTDRIRVGIIGVGRGQSFARGATDAVGMKLVALCDTWKERLEQVGREYGVATYTDYDRSSNMKWTRSSWRITAMSMHLSPSRPFGRKNT